MAGRLKYEKRYRYPHMLKEDIEVWKRFMELYPSKFETVDYDFRVGRGSEAAYSLDDPYNRMALMLSQKRIDVLAWVDEQPTIIEVKIRVGLGAMGQVLGYRTLFMKYFPHFPNPEMMIVCETISADDRDVLEDSNIPVEVV